MEAGADFASSPGRILIDFIDPLLVAKTIATTDKKKYISARDIANIIKEGELGISGIGATGKKCCARKCNKDVIRMTYKCNKTMNA